MGVTVYDLVINSHMGFSALLLLFFLLRSEKGLQFFSNGFVSGRFNCWRDFKENGMIYAFKVEKMTCTVGGEEIG